MSFHPPDHGSLGAAPPPVPAATFSGEVTAHFAAWDRDHDGVFSAAEVDTAVADPKVTGEEAAAIVAISELFAASTACRR